MERKKFTILATSLNLANGFRMTSSEWSVMTVPGFVQLAKSSRYLQGQSDPKVLRTF